MQLLPLALCLVAGSVQTIALSSSVISLYNMSIDGAGGSLIDASGSPINLYNAQQTPPSKISGGINKNQYNMHMLYLILATLGVVFGLMILAKPDTFDNDTGKIIVAVITLVWLLVTFITCATANVAFSGIEKLQNNINMYYNLNPQVPFLNQDLTGAMIPVKNNQMGFVVSYSVTTLLAVAAIVSMIM